MIPQPRREPSSNRRASRYCGVNLLGVFSIEYQDSINENGQGLGRKLVSLADLTHQSVEAALVEAASIGRDKFLKQYGFGPARRYFVEWNGAGYDSKAIAGAAHGHLRGKTH